MAGDSNENIQVMPDIESKGFFPEFPPSTYEEWLREAVASLKGAPFEKLISKTYEEIDLQPIYGAKDVEDLPHMDSLPGFPDYVRGTTFGGYVLKAWDICQEIASPTPEEFNEAAVHDLGRGQNAPQAGPGQFQPAWGPIPTGPRLGKRAGTAFRWPPWMIYVRPCVGSICIPSH